MLKILSHLMGKRRSVMVDARRVYKNTMVQSRNAVFYGDNLCADSTDGRMEILCMHLSVIIFALREHGDNGAKLSQAVYDVMVEDFDIALREEGLADTGVSRRIKPLANLFFVRAKAYAKAFEAPDETDRLVKSIIEEHVCKQGKPDSFVVYVVSFLSNLQKQSIGEIALGQLNFPKLH